MQKISITCHFNSMLMMTIGDASVTGGKPIRIPLTERLAD